MRAGYVRAAVMFVLVALSGLFVAAAGGAEWGTEAAGWLACGTLFFAFAAAVVAFASERAP